MTASARQTEQRSPTHCSSSYQKCPEALSSLARVCRNLYVCLSISALFINVSLVCTDELKQLAQGGGWVNFAACTFEIKLVGGSLQTIYVWCEVLVRGAAPISTADRALEAKHKHLHPACPHLTKTWPKVVLNFRLNVLSRDIPSN